MNPAYRTARFWCAIGPGEVPAPCFGIVTACDPADRPLGDDANRDADAGLAHEVDRLGWRRFRVVGASPDLVHQEPGWGVVPGSLAVLLDLGFRWGQAAVFWVDRDELFLADCREGTIERLGCWSERTRFGQALGPWRVDLPCQG
jgi:hypothetical protein